MYYTGLANPASEWGDLSTLAREMYITGPMRPLNSVIKSQVYLKCALQIRRFFCVTRMYMHVRWDVREAIVLSV